MAPAAPLQRVGPAVRVIIHRSERSGNNAFGADEAEDGEVVVAVVVVVVGDERLHVGRDVLEIPAPLHVRVIQDRDRLGLAPDVALQRRAAVPAGDPLRVAEEGADRVDVVDAVIQDLEPLLRRQPRPHLPRRVDADLDRRIGHLADPAVADQRARGAEPLAPAELLVDRQLHAGLLPQADDLGGLGQLVGERLLAQHVFAGGRHLAHDIELRPRRHGNLDDLDRLVIQQLVQLPVHVRDVELARRLFGRLVAHIVAGDHVELVLPVGGQRGVIDDPPAADDPDAVVDLRRQVGFVVQVEKWVGHGSVPPGDQVIAMRVSGTSGVSGPVVGTHRSRS